MSRQFTSALALTACVCATLPSTPRAESAAPSDSLVLCDLLYDDGNLKGSENVARAILQREPASHEVLWRLSRALISTANLAENDQEKQRHFETAHALAQRAVDLSPEGPRGLTCLAISAGSLSEFAGGGRKIKLAEAARDAAQRAIDLDDENDLAYLVLGIWNREIATVGGLTRLAAKIFYGGVPEGASLANSESCLRRAIALAPERLNHHRELGITLAAMGRIEEAIAELEHAVGLNPTQPEDGIYLQSALDLLAELREEHADSPWQDW